MSHISGKWNDIIVPVTGSGNGAVVPAMTNVVGNIATYGFQTGDFFYGAFEIPHDYKEGTSLTAHIHWAPSSTNTGNCVWNLEYSIAPSGGAYTAAVTLAVTQAGSGVANTHQFANFAPVISGTGVTIGTVIIYRLIRLAAGNTFTGLGLGLSLGIHYESDSIGSNQIGSKN